MRLASASSRVRVAREEPFVLPDPDFALLVAEKMRSQGSAYLRVSGGSMVPWIRAGDFVFVRQFDFTKVAAGDVIVFGRNGLVVTHRVIRRVDAVPRGKNREFFYSPRVMLRTKQTFQFPQRSFLGEQRAFIAVGSTSISIHSFKYFWGASWRFFRRMSRLVYGPRRFGKHVFPARIQSTSGDSHRQFREALIALRGVAVCSGLPASSPGGPVGSPGWVPLTNSKSWPRPARQTRRISKDFQTAVSRAARRAYWWPAQPTPIRLPTTRTMAEAAEA